MDCMRCGLTFNFSVSASVFLTRLLVPILLCDVGTFSRYEFGTVCVDFFTPLGRGSGTGCSLAAPAKCGGV